MPTVRIELTTFRLRRHCTWHCTWPALQQLPLAARSALTGRPADTIEVLGGGHLDLRASRSACVAPAGRVGQRGAVGRRPDHGPGRLFRRQPRRGGGRGGYFDASPGEAAAGAAAGAAAACTRGPARAGAVRRGRSLWPTLAGAPKKKKKLSGLTPLEP